MIELIQLNKDQLERMKLCKDEVVAQDYRIAKHQLELIEKEPVEEPNFRDSLAYTHNRYMLDVIEGSRFTKTKREWRSYYDNKEKFKKEWEEKKEADRKRANRELTPVEEGEHYGYGEQDASIFNN